MEPDEIAEMIGVDSATVTRDGRLVRGWLFQQLDGGPAGLG
ncbi:hypothetical protein [Tahibacter sp.]|nr:hypothetical protein [Tahibacter sp.]